MAEAAVNFILEKLRDVALNNALELYHVREQVDLMQRELRLIQCLLRHADSKRNRDPLVKQWVSEVRDVAHRIEDVMDTFLVGIEENQPNNSGIISKLKSLVKIPWTIEYSNEVKNITESLKMIYERRIHLIRVCSRTRIRRGEKGRVRKDGWFPCSRRVTGGGKERNLGFVFPSTVAISLPLDSGCRRSNELIYVDFSQRAFVPSFLLGLRLKQHSLGITNISDDSRENCCWLPFRPTKLSDIDVSEVVGLDSDKNQIIRHLLDRTIQRRTVLSIVGIGGLGKTTLAQKVYKSAELEKQFDCCTWLSISQKFNILNLLREILYSVDPQLKFKTQPVKDEDLPMELNRSLNKKRYLIILDDVWTVDLWDRLRIILPDVKNRSRVLITSRSLDVAMMADPDTKPYKLPYLNEEDSLALILRKAFPYKQSDYSPPGLMKVAKQLTKRCGGLPLALVVVGGVLSRREPTYNVWYKVKQTLDWHSQDGEKCMQILALSYEDLPHHLKQCFLYFSSFPEDYMMSANHLTRMWIAEGFIPKDAAGTLEEKAEVFLEELVQRCLVQVVQKSWNGYCKFCSMHDLLRDLAIHEAKETKFFTVFSKAEDGSQLTAKPTRRAALQFSTLTVHEIQSKYTRSLLFYGKCITNYYGLKLLRVLSIERVRMSEKEAKYEGGLESLINLRYLGFRYCELPQGFWDFSFNSLKKLETLDLKGTKAFGDGQVSYSLWQIPTLRHVISACAIFGPSRWDILKNLQTLKWARLQEFHETECTIILRKIGLELSTDIDEVWDVLKALLIRTEQLESLAIKLESGYVQFGIVGTSDLPCHETIQCLYLAGMWPMDIVLTVDILPTNLAKFTLASSNLRKDPMPVLEKLQSLRILRLLEDSYVGRELICSAGGFPSLQKLELESLPNLQNWHIKEGAMPMLHHLKIDWCDNLCMLPELQMVPTLQSLYVSHPSPALQRRMHSEDQYKIRHISSVHAQR